MSRVVAFVAAQPALVIGFALQGSIKELAGVALLTTAVALVAAALADRRPARSLIALAAVAAAALEALGPAALAYLAVPGFVAIAVWGVRAIRERSGSELVGLAAAGAAALVLALPVLSTLSGQITVQSDVLKASDNPTGFAARVAIGNLAEPLETTQALGIWLSGDYRYRPLESSLQTPQDIALLDSPGCWRCSVSCGSSRAARGDRCCSPGCWRRRPICWRAAARTPTRRC